MPHCENVANLIKSKSVQVSDDMTDDVLKKSVSFSCLPGMVLNGPNSTTCMENGEWEPDPREVACNGKTKINYVQE